LFVSAKFFKHHNISDFFGAECFCKVSEPESV